MSINATILFVSVGRRVELLRCFQKAHVELGTSGRVVAVDADPFAPALQTADASYIVPRLKQDEFIPTLLKILERESVNAIFPLIDTDVPVLSRNREILESTNAKLAVVRPEACEIAADKWLTYNFFRRLELPTPQTWLPDQLEPTTIQFPLFVKPRFGSASESTFKVRNLDELNFFCRYVPQPVIQEFLPGPEITNDVICGLDGRVLSVVSRQRIKVRSGEVLVGKTIYDPAIARVCLRVAEMLPAIGPITLQCMMKEGQPFFTEINARLGGGAPVGIAAGADWARWLVAHIAGIPVEIPPIGSYDVELFFSRFDDSMILTRERLDALASYNI